MLKNLGLKITVLSLLAVFMIACGGTEKKTQALKKKETPYTQLNQEQKEMRKAKEFKVKKRDTYSYFYNKYGKVDEKGFLVESLLYDEKGNLTEHLFYTSRGAIDRKYVYEYDGKGNIIKNEAYDVFGDLRNRQFSEYDEFGNIVEAKVFNIKLNDYNKVEFIYDKDGNLLEKTTYDPDDTVIEKTVNEYDSSGVLLHTIRYGKGERVQEKDYFQYDSLGNKIKMTMDIPGTLPKFYTYKYDENNNMIEERSVHYIKRYAFDKDNNVLMEEVYDKDEYLQTRFQYFYDERGLLKEKIRYDGMGKPAIYIRYQYEFYN